MNIEIPKSWIIVPKKDLWRRAAAITVAGSLGLSACKVQRPEEQTPQELNRPESVLELKDEVLFPNEFEMQEIEMQESEVINIPLTRPLSEDEIRNIVSNAFNEANSKIESGKVTAASSSGVEPIHSGDGWVKEVNPNDDIWAVLADCESGDGDVGPPYYVQWAYNGPSRFDGAFQFLPETWSTANGNYDFAWQAPPEEQVETARSWVKKTSWLSQWPSCSERMIDEGYSEAMLAEGPLSR